MPDNTQNNILITRDGQACLGEFGITGAFPSFSYDWRYEQTTFQYMAPECLHFGVGRKEPNRYSNKSDVYSLAVTSFFVRSPGLNHAPP